MLSLGPVVLAIRVLTIVAWGVVIYDALPIWPYLPDAASRLVLGVAVCGTVKYIATRCAKPWNQVYEAGKAMGRLEVLREQRNADAVVSLDDRRRLRDTQNGERQVVGEFWPI